MNHPIEQLEQIMTKLRDPEGGCPWDLKQILKQLSPYYQRDLWGGRCDPIMKDWSN